MKRLVLFYFIGLCFVISSKAQNLVSNPSFEYTNCPVSFSNINGCLPWVGTIGTPDYYNTCSTNSSTSVPYNFFGGNFQYANSGNGYAGIQTFVLSQPNTRENIAVQLTSNLVLNTYYLAKFHIVNIQAYRLANNNIGLYFSNNLTYTVNAGSTVNLPMHIYKYGNPVIKDTLNWTEIRGVYKANGTEQYITIGNFKDDANTKIDTTNYGSFGNAAYYMIDDVSVEPICTPFWSYRDTTLAIGQDSVLIGPAITGLNINWYDATNTFITNAPGIYVKPAQTTTYTAVEDFCGTTYTNTIVVTVQPTGFAPSPSERVGVRLFPNPSNGIVNITSSYGFEKIELLGITGHVLLSESVNSKTHQLQLQNFAEGFYFVKIIYADGLSSVKKIIVSR